MMFDITFHMLATWVPAFKKCLLRYSAHFKNWIVCFLFVELCEFFLYFGYVLYILEIPFADIFSHLYKRLPYLLVVSLTVQKLLCCQFIFSFVFLAFRFKFTKTPRPIPTSSVPTFSCMYFVVSGLTFKSLMYFELVFVYSVRS